MSADLNNTILSRAGRNWYLYHRRKARQLEFIPIQPVWAYPISLPTATVGEFYSYNLGNHLTSFDGVVFTDSGVVLPAGLVYNRQYINGIPTVPGIVAGIITTATNTIGFADSAAYAITVV